MKVPVYLEKTLELIGVVDIDQYQVDTIVARGGMQVVTAPSLPDLSTLSKARVAFTAPPQYTRYFISYFPIQNSFGARSICLMVSSPEAMKAFERRLWPRKRKNKARRRRFKRSMMRSAKSWLHKPVAVGAHVMSSRSAIFGDDVT